MTDNVFPRAVVHARWAYSEIVDGSLARAYDHFDQIEELRAKRSANVSFENLSQDDVTRLAWMCSIARPDMFAFCANFKAFSLEALNRVELGAVVVPPHIPPNRFHIWFSHLMESRADASRVSLPSGEYRLPDFPITLGRVHGHYVLVDGYRRAADFWRSASESNVIWAFVPE